MNQQQTHQLLQTSQSRFISLFEQSPQSMVLFSPSGYIRAANQAFEEMFNLAADDLIAENFNLIEHDTVMESGIFEHIFIGFTQKFIELPQAVVFRDNTVCIKGNEDSWLRCCLYPVRDDQGEVMEVVMMHRDVSTQFPPALFNFNRELENQVAERTRKLKSMNDALIRSRIREAAAMRARDEFFSNASHELRTPLTAIKEAAAMLCNGLYGDQPRKQQDLFAIVKEECDRLIRSVDNMLDMSKKKADIGTYQFENSDIRSLLTRNLRHLDPIARKRNICLELAGESDLPAVRMDREKIHRVMTNLIGNALKFTPPGGRVTVSAQKTAGESPAVRISVCDTGRGMAPGEIDHVFNRFRQIRPKNGGKKGFGLGLFIVQSIISEHRGEIWAESEPGKGSRFYFTLPVPR